MEPLHSHRGFTLIEMLVVLAIITILAAIVLTSQSAFNRTLVLDSTAYDIGLTVRSAETYGIGSRVTSISTSNIGYGVDFEFVTPGAFTLFGDTYPPVTSPQPKLCHTIPGGDPSRPDAQPGDCRYETSGPGSDVTVSSFTVGNGIKIVDLEVLVQTGGVSTWETHLSKLDVVFSRPNAEPFISALPSSNGASWQFSANNAMNSTGGATVEKACILLGSLSGGTRAVEVNMAGEITADTTTCS